MTTTAKRTLPDGWMGKRCRGWLRRQAQHATEIIEVGSWLGRSTRVLAKASQGRVWAVDHWRGTPNDPAQHEKLYAETLATRNVYAEFCANLKPEIQAGRVVPVQLPSVEGAAVLRDRMGTGWADFIFIDADHSYEGCRGDIAAFLPLLRAGGVLGGHDAHWPGVKRAVEEGFPAAEYGPGSIWSMTV